MTKTYDVEFKLNAVKLAKKAKQEGISISETSRNLGLSKSILHKWIKASEHKPVLADAFPGKGHLPAAEEELRKLRRELDITRQERDVLKKAIAIFSHPNR
jgi:transposase